jgi:hypothetical protein
MHNLKLVLPRVSWYTTKINRILILILFVYLVGCQLAPKNINSNDQLNWKYADLRLLDPIDAVEPDQDLIALYTRINNQSFQIRIDFLDLKTDLGKDIYIPLDTNPGGLALINTNDGNINTDINWDYLIKIPASGNIGIVDDHLSKVSGIELFIVYDTNQDKMVISFNRSDLPIYLGQTKLQVIITPPNQNIVSDISEPFSTDSASPTRAKVLFAFWTTFSSSTPAQTLRSWAGAHVGPLRGRHGLKYLLEGAEQTRSTVFLLDLLTPGNLSALDYINVLPWIRKLADQGILALPDVGNVIESGAIGQPIKNVGLYNVLNIQDINKIWQIDNNVKVITSPENSNIIIFLNKLVMLNKREYNVVGVDYAQYIDSNDYCGLLTSPNGEGHPSFEFSLKCKSVLLSHAISNPSTPLLLGGDFSNSILGDPSISAEVFSYISEHPWLQVISLQDLATSSEVQTTYSLTYQESQLSNSLSAQQSSLLDNSNSSLVQSKVHESLLQSPKNQLSILAWEVYSSLLHPGSPESLSLRSNYMGQIGQILSAADWAENAIPRETCSIDLDYDGRNECILANKYIFAIIEPEGGYIPFLFANDDRGIHQIIGPTWEFEVGLSDASNWNPNLGVRGDPAQILGAFQDNLDNWNNYDVNILENKISMYSNNMSMRKSITIYPDSLHIDLQNLNQLQNNSTIPLVIDPWSRYTSGWGDLYTLSRLPLIFQWGINSLEMVEVRSPNLINDFTFNATHSALAFPEDPNYDYSLGHYLPYPMALVIITATEKYSIDIIINP